MRRPKIVPDCMSMGLHAAPSFTVATVVRVPAALALFAFVLGAYAVEPPPAIAHIPIDAGSEAGAPASMVAGVYLPPGDGPFPVLIYSHGRSSAEADRAGTTFPDPRGHVRYWRNKG